MLSCRDLAEVAVGLLYLKTPCPVPLLANPRPLPRCTATGLIILRIKSRSAYLTFRWFRERKLPDSMWRYGYLQCYPNILSPVPTINRSSQSPLKYFHSQKNLLTIVRTHFHSKCHHFAYSLRNSHSRIPFFTPFCANCKHSATHSKRDSWLHS